MIRFAAALAALLLPAAAHGQAAQCDAPIPAPAGWVNDFAGVISDSAEARLTALVLEVREKSHGEIVVVTLPSLHGCTEAEMGMRIGRTWGVGFRGEAEDPRTHTGVVILVVPSERKARIEFGSGTARFISNDAAQDILRERMFPHFRAARFDDGIEVGVLEIARAFATRFGFTLQTVRRMPCASAAPSAPC